MDKMKKYKNGEHIITATERAYKTLYAEQGYVPYTEKNNKKKEEAKEG